MVQNMGYELDWDSTIDQDEQAPFTLLPEGDYSFVVDHIDRGYVGSESEKYAGNKMATVYLNVEAPDGDEASVRENFILHSNFLWKIGALLVSTGVKKKGEAISGNYWAKLPGMRGRCKIVQTPSKRNPDQKFNNVDKFYAPDDTADSGNNKWVL